MTRWVRSGSTQKHKKMPADATKWGEFDNQKINYIPPSKKRKHVQNESIRENLFNSALAASTSKGMTSLTANETLNFQRRQKIESQLKNDINRNKHDFLNLTFSVMPNSSDETGDKIAFAHQKIFKKIQMLKESGMVDDSCSSFELESSKKKTTNENEISELASNLKHDIFASSDILDEARGPERKSFHQKDNHLLKQKKKKNKNVKGSLINIDSQINERSSTEIQAGLWDSSDKTGIPENKTFLQSKNHLHKQTKKMKKNRDDSLVDKEAYKSELSSNEKQDELSDSLSYPDKTLCYESVSHLQKQKKKRKNKKNKDDSLIDEEAQLNELSSNKKQDELHGSPTYSERTQCHQNNSNNLKQKKKMKKNKKNRNVSLDEKEAQINESNQNEGELYESLSNLEKTLCHQNDNHPKKQKKKMNSRKNMNDSLENKEVQYGSSPEKSYHKSDLQKQKKKNRRGKKELLVDKEAQICKPTANQKLAGFCDSPDGSNSPKNISNMDDSLVDKEAHPKSVEIHKKKIGPELHKRLERRKKLGLIVLPPNVEQRLYRKRKALMRKGLASEMQKEIMRKERRNAELEFRKIAKPSKVCLHCRKPGHLYADCPDKSDSTGICFKCGSSEHTSFKCPKKVQGFPFATCFICKDHGHISRECPRNKHGVYPKGGKCNLCGNVNHLKKDCPSLVKRKTEEEPTIALHTISAGESIDAEVIENNRAKKHIEKKPKVVKF